MSGTRNPELLDIVAVLDAGANTDVEVGDVGTVVEVFASDAVEVVVPEKLSNALFFPSEIDGMDGILCKEVMDDRPKPCHFGLGMEDL